MALPSMTHRWRIALATLATLAALGFGGSVQAKGEFRGVVIRVSDGDSVWVKPHGGGKRRVVRLLGLDAPEICQAHGPQARAALAQRVLNQPVTVRVAGRDKYRRTLARLGTRAQPDVGAWLVSQGHAWSWRERSDAGPYAVQQARARGARRGLWALPAAQEPRAFRREHGPCR